MLDRISFTTGLSLSFTTSQLPPLSPFRFSLSLSPSHPPLASLPLSTSATPFSLPPSLTLPLSPVVCSLYSRHSVVKVEGILGGEWRELLQVLHFNHSLQALPAPPVDPQACPSAAAPPSQTTTRAGLLRGPNLWMWIRIS